MADLKGIRSPYAVANLQIWVGGLILCILAALLVHPNGFWLCLAIYAGSVTVGFWTLVAVNEWAMNRPVGVDDECE